MSMDISAFEKVALKYSNQFNKQNATGQIAEKGEFFLAIITKHIAIFTNAKVRLIRYHIR